MKKSSLLAIALLLSFGIFAQTSVKNAGTIRENTSIKRDKSGSQVNSSTNASSNSNIQTDAAKEAKNKTYAEIKKENETTIATSKKTKAEAKSAAKESKKMTAHEMSGSASANSSTNSTLSGKDNNISDNTSIVSGTSLSTSVEKLNLHKTNKNGEAKGATMADATMENGHQLSTNVNKPDLKSRERVKSFASTTVHAGSTSGSNIKLHPVSLKTNTLVKTNGGFKLK